MTNHPPIIVIGMHRSGTSMVTRILERMGLFMGWRKDRVNSEAIFFWRLNEWALSQTGFGWDRPPTSIEWPEDPLLLQMMEAGVHEALAGLGMIEYWGPVRFFAQHSSGCKLGPWGWKDPRNTLTLPLWLSIFPNARVLHIRRHGLDVACSLKSRNDALKKNFRARQLRYPLMIPGLKNLWVSRQCADIAGGFALWEKYMAFATQHVKTLGKQALDVKYEDFLSDPKITALQVATFCGLDPNPYAVESACSHLRSDRACAYRSNPELKSLGTEFSSRLAAYGY